jgi:uncharacterized protein YukJ
VSNGSVKIIVVNQIDETSVSVYFVSEGQLTHPLTVIMGQVATE